MDVISANREVGSYRGAAVICWTIHKTVKRIIETHNAGGISVEKPPTEHCWPRHLACAKQNRSLSGLVCEVTRSKELDGVCRKNRTQLPECPTMTDN